MRLRTMGKSVLALVLFLCGFWLLGWSQAFVGPSQMDLCDQAAFTVTVTNASATQEACHIVLRNAVPNAGFTLVPGTSTLTLAEVGETFHADPTDGAWDIDALRGTPYALPPGGEITLSFDLATSCDAVSGNDTLTVDFENCAVPGVPLRNTSSTSIEILPGAVIVTKTPSVADASVGDEVTWTVTVENTGLGSVKNVVVTDTLGAGLEFVSASDGGTPSGAGIVWDGSTTPSLLEIAAGSSVPLSLTARVIACEGLADSADVRWSCDSGEVCEDSSIVGSCGCETATASIALVIELPNLTFTAPAITVPYCTMGETVVIPIENVGAGNAHNVKLCLNLGGLSVDNVQGAASYDGSCFLIPLIPGGATFDLTFDVAFGGDWCAGAPSGTPIYTLTYENDCGIEHRARPQFGSIGFSGGASLSASKSGPVLVKLGEDLTYGVSVTYAGPTSCGVGTVGTVTIVDSVPSGFVVVDAGGGTILPSGDIEWTFDPAVDPSFSSAVTIRVPNDCGFCYTETSNDLSASVLDCCGCTRTASASAPLVIECDLLYTSNMTVTPDSLVRCGSPATLTDAHVFGDDASLDSVSFDEYQYATLPSNGLAYVPGSLTVTVDGAPVSATVSDGTPDGPLAITLSGTDSVRGHTLTYTYQLEATAASAPACGGASFFYVWSSHQLGPDAPAGACGTFYDATPVSIEPPSMSVSLSGIPTIQDECATYDVTLTLSRTSPNAVPYDARVVLSGLSPYGADAASASCFGVSPTGGTSCTSPIETPDTMEWRFADAFASGDVASITLPVTVPCGGPLLALSAEAFFDDLCADDAVYDDLCSVSGGGSASLSVAADVCVSKTPEVIFAAGKEVTWTLCFTNVGNGAATGTWIEDTLGPGLEYVSSSISDPTGAAEHPNEDRSGAAANGVTWRIDGLQPGEERTIELTARLIACNGMTNTVAVGWGCVGQECQAPKTDSSSVVVPTSSMVATSYLPTPISVCTTETAIVTVKNAGVTSTYDVIAEVTLPNGLSYAGSPEYRVGVGAWLSTVDPAGTPGPTLTWTAVQIPALAEVGSRAQVQIRFSVATDCAFNGGVMSFQAGYKNPCGSEFTSNVGAFSVSARIPSVTVAVRQVSPAAGEAIDCGGEATWEIDVRNAGTIVIPVLRVGALLDDGLVYVGSTGDATYGPADGGANSGSSVAWELVALPAGATATLSMTASAPGGTANCEALDVFFDAYWGCGLVDGTSSTADAQCLTSSPTTATISGSRVPPIDLAVTFSPDAIEGCADTTTLTLSIQNTSAIATASNFDVAITLPSTLAYVAETTEVDCGGGFVAGSNPAAAGSTLTWYNLGAKGEGSDLCLSVPPGGSVHLRFDVDASCYLSTQSLPISVSYYDCCGLTQRTVETSATLTARVPDLSLSKTPGAVALDCANPLDEVTWTIRVVNNGTGTADVVRVEDTLGADLERVSGGAQLGSDPQAWGWEFGPLAPGASHEVTLVARLAAPPDDCAAARRTNTVRATWECGSLDGDPNTSTGTTCASGIWRQTTAVVQIANLAVSETDVVPQFTCTGDGVGSGSVAVTIRNTSDAPIAADFGVAIGESTTGWSVSQTFTALGGALPIEGNSAQVLTIPGWPVACSDCAYHFTVTLDTSGQICECAEGNNTTTLDYTLTVPNLMFDSANLAIVCSGDGQIRLQGPIVVRNAGCSSAYGGAIPLRVTVYDAAGCTGNILTQFTTSLTGASIAAGGTQSFTLNQTRTVAACGTCQATVRLELDYADAICECDGTDNALCLGPYAIAFPDLRVLSVDVSGIACAGDAVSGSVGVTVENAGCGVAGAFDVSLATDGCLSFASQRVAGLTAGASTVVTFPVRVAWGDCTDCGCTFTATVDAGGEVCECTVANNQGSSAFTLARPDLEVSSASLALSCAGDGEARLSGSVLLANTGCAAVAGSVELRITVSDGAGCAGDIIASWIETLFPVSLAAGGGTQAFPVDHVIVEDLCTFGACGFSARLDVDPSGIVCECDGTDNVLCVSVSSSVPDLVVALATPSVPVACAPGSVLVAVRNVGCGVVPAGVVVRVSGDAIGEGVTTGSLSAGVSEIVAVTFDRALACGDHTVTVTVDPDGDVCECDDGNNADVVAFAVVDPDAAFSDLAVTCRGDGSFDVSVDLDNLSTQGQADIGVAWLIDGTPSSTTTRTLAPGGSAALSFETPALKCGTEHAFRVVADLSDAFCECDETNNAAEAAATCPCPALVTTKSIAAIQRGGTSIDVGGPIEPGDVVTYAMTVRNVGGGTAFNVDVEDALPSPFSYVPGTSSATWPSGSSTADPAGGAGPDLTFDLFATLAAGNVLALSFDATVGSGLTPSVEYINTMTAKGVEGEGSAIPADTHASVPADVDDDDTSTVSIQAAEPALVTAKAVAAIVRDGVAIPVSSPVGPGDRVRYQVTATNVGNGTAYDVDLADVLPDGFSYVSGTTSAVWPAGVSTADPTGGAGPSLDFNLSATLPAGGMLTLTFGVLLTASVDEIGPYVNTVMASGVDGAGTPVPADNSADVPADTDDDDASDATLLPAPPALVTTKSVATIVRAGTPVSTAGPIEPGDVIAYRLTVENVGRGTAHAVSLSDTLPSALTYVDGSTSGSWSADPAGRPGPTLTWTPSATLGFGDTLVLEFDAQAGPVLEGSIYVNTMTAFASDADGSPTSTDRSDEVPEDTDDDDSSIVSLPGIIPGLVVDKTITDVRRGGISLGPVSVAVPGDVVEYRFTIRNVGNGTAYSVDFTDRLPPGLEYEAGAPYGVGTYAVTAPAASGGLSVPDGGTSFATSIAATIDGGGRLVATYYARITESAQTGVPLQNVAEAEGLNGAGIEIPDANPVVGDTSDDDVEDPDADDTGVAAIRVGMPALAVDKQTLDVERRGTSIGAAGPVEPGDVIVYRFVIRNVGTDTAYGVGFIDVLPPGLEIERTSGAGSYTVDAPAAGPLPLGLADGATGSVTASLGARVARGGTLTATYRARVTSDISQGDTLVNTARAFGVDVVGAPIPPSNGLVGDTFDDDPDDADADDTGREAISTAEPALVTEKSVDEIRRDGVFIGPQRPVRPGDVVSYNLRIVNVGLGTAYGVAVSDALPTGVAYEGPSLASWPRGSSSAAPAGGTGPTLMWNLNATLDSGDEIVIAFEAKVTTTAVAAGALVNVLRAAGADGNGMPIPADNGADVPLDDDADDADSVRLTLDPDVLDAARVPALVTEKSVARILRGRDTKFGSVVEPGDLVTFELAVRNVGDGTAYQINMSDRLPEAFEYIAGSSAARWPLGASLDDPSGGAGPELAWTLLATLRAGETLRLTFDVRVRDDLLDGQSLVNHMEARGEDAGGAPIPPDQSEEVPADDDADDAAELSLTTRSSLVQGEGGTFRAPILRKDIERLSGEPCRRVEPVLRPVWFQTDIALYAAVELELLATWPQGVAVSSETLLPTWLRTAAFEADGVGFDNVIAVSGASGVGIPLSFGPRFRSAADPVGELERTLDAYARAAGINPEGRPADERWIVLEYAAGDPRFATLGEAEYSWPSGDWSAYDRRIIPSAVGMSLLKQAMESRRLLASDVALDRYLGYVLVEIMRNKVASLDDLRAATGSAEGLLAHAYAAVLEGVPATYVVQDGRADLFDQLALVWGLSAYVELASDPALWPDVLGSAEPERTEARRWLDVILDGTARRLRGFDGSLRESTSDAEGAPARTTTLGLLLAALENVSRVVGDHSAVERLAVHAATDLAGRIGVDDRMTADGAGLALADQSAAVRGLLAAAAVLDAPAYAADGARLAASLERDFWDPSLEAFVTQSAQEGSDLCTTPLDLGLVVGALREAAAVSSGQDAERWAVRIAHHVRTIVDSAALHLGKALPDNGLAAFAVDGSGFIAPARVSDAPFGWAYVLQDRLCVPRRADVDDPCTGLQVDEDGVYYQTDWAMYAGFELEAVAPWAEDYADANLIAAILHAGLGEPLDSSRWRRSAEGVGIDLSTLRPVSTPYAGGSPALAGDTSLAWDPATFDMRRTGSALGMTLLREAQEVGQLLASASGDTRDRTTAELLFSSALETLDVLGWIVDAANEAFHVSYVPHAVVAERVADAWRIDVSESQSRLFDQISLLWGLSELGTLVQRPESESLLTELGRTAADVGRLVLEVADAVLDTLLIHLDSATGRLVDEVQRTPRTWVLDDRVDETTLALVVPALTGFLRSPLAASRPEAAGWTRGLVPMLLDLLATLNSASAGDGCDAGDLTTELAALRAFAAGFEALGDPRWRDAACVAFARLNELYWDEVTGMYRASAGAPVGCYTPLDLGLLVGSLARLIPVLDATSAARAGNHLHATFERWTDAAKMQLSSRALLRDGEPAGGYAAVFDRLVCLRPVEEGTVSGDHARAGDLLRYRIAVDNATDETWTDLVLTDALPAGLVLEDAFPAPEEGAETLRWPFATLNPGEERTWTLLARVPDDADPGRTYENCATLTYHDATGLEQPTRRACVETSLDNPPNEKTKAAWWVELPDYDTAEAMYLSTILMQLTPAAWTHAASGMEYALGNLGALLEDSRLGILLTESDGDLRAVRDDLARLTDGTYNARRILDNLVLVPYRGGEPILVEEGGFRTQDPTITAEALGQTLAMEAEALRFYESQTGTWADTAAALLRDLATFQLSWIDEHRVRDADGTSYFPRALVATADAQWSASEGGSELYGQASLLWGLGLLVQRLAGGNEARNLGERLVDSTFDRIVDHADAATGTYAAVLPSEAPRRAMWRDLELVARALDFVARSPSSRAGAAFERLQALIAAAETAELPTDPVEATAHLRVLLFARTTSERAEAAWQSLRARYWAPLYAVLADPSTPASAWTFTPRDAAVLFDLLATLSDRGETSLHDLDRSFETIVDTARLQLVAPPSGYWQDASSSAPAHVAPVFGRVASLHGLQRRPAGISDGQSGDLLLFTVDLTVPVRLGPIRSLLIDCAQGLSYVPGSAQYGNELGEWVRLAVPRLGPLRFEIPRLDRVARIEYLMWRTDDVWANWIDGEWIDASGRSLPWDS